VDREPDPELSFDVDVLLPESYIREVGVRLSLYKRLASAADSAEVDDVAREIEDRFGAPPREARNLVDSMRLKTDLRRLRALGCEATHKTVTLHLSVETRLDPKKITALVAEKRSQYRLFPDMRLTRKASEGESFASGIAHADRALHELRLCLIDS
jgi:transcription-repair coupling factor (superfamily II helicase)